MSDCYIATDKQGGTKNRWKIQRKSLKSQIKNEQIKQWQTKSKWNSSTTVDHPNSGNGKDSNNFCGTARLASLWAGRVLVGVSSYFLVKFGPPLRPPRKITSTGSHITHTHTHTCVHTHTEEDSVIRNNNLGKMDAIFDFSLISIYRQIRNTATTTTTNHHHTYDSIDFNAP